jgi:dienelactone hydrolase
MDLGWHGEDDLGGALDLLAGRSGVDPSRLGAVGLSMGGEEALALVGAPMLAAVVAEGATGRGGMDDGWLPTHLGGVVQRGLDRWQDLLVGGLTGVEPPSSLRSRVAAADTPVLLVAAGDRPDEERAARWIEEAAPGSVEVWVVPGASHTGGLDHAPGEWSDRVLGFLDATLGPGARDDGSGSGSGAQ